ncbi:TlpA family protein disulfide reductase [Nonlabens agnitus]|uniref:Thioredoxin domain-containing protein n=1 Tax=Nonlabens agnitus TaxID=870484 RepID=A0A2S9WRF9_9FLAO|nr:hypothetical protein [Nonlabens agnitus]PRP66061.1 hypothetical protein BST86_02650 [Nonlabens agnitus]
MIKLFTLSRKRTFTTRLLILSIIWIPFLYSCEEDTSGTTYISGKVVNPEVSYVVITNYTDIRDTLQLDNNGNFETSFEDLTSGLYSISYPGEYQSFYIVQGDSLGMRANTKAFDETLAFTGAHSKENNFLIQLFIDIEKSNMRLLKYKNESPKVFYKNVQNVKKERLKNLDNAVAKYNFEDRFVDFAKFIINLNSYYELERYPILNDGNPYEDEGVVFPEEFFAHRQRLDLNKTKLLNNYAFRPFMNAMVSNIAFKKLSIKNDDDVDLNSYYYNKERLAIIDSTLTDETLKNYFAASEIRNFIRRRKNAKDINLLVNDFLTISTDQRVNAEIAQMASTYISLDPGQPLPNFKLRDIENETVMLKEEVKHLTVLYYWSIQDKNYAVGIHEQVKDLQLKYPEIEFIGINIDDLGYDEWQDVIAQNNFRDSREFQISGRSSVERQLALRNSNRSMVVDHDLTIIDPNINLFYYRIETTLLGYINR